jgi:transposase-like protein
MGLNLSNRQIAHELGLCESDVQAMTEVLRQGIVAKTPDVVLSGNVEFDEVYVVAGHKGNPEAVRATGQQGRRNRLKGVRGRGTLDKDKPPVFGMIERDGQVVIQMLAHVQQATIHPIIEKTVAKGSTVYTDEYAIYARLPSLGYEHKTICHGHGEYARDEDGAGFCEVHVNTMEGFWSLLRSWLRPHRGISQEKLPLFLGVFQVVHNARRRGKALLGFLIEALVA